MRKGGKIKRRGGKQHSSLQPSSLPKAHHQPRSSSSLRLHPSLLFATYLKIACPSGDKLNRADRVAVCDGEPMFPRFLFSLFSTSSMSTDALVSPSTNPVLIHPTQRAENGCKCIFLKRQSQWSTGDDERSPDMLIRFIWASFLLKNTLGTDKYTMRFRLLNWQHQKLWVYVVCIGKLRVTSFKGGGGKFLVLCMNSNYMINRI